MTEANLARNFGIKTKTESSFAKAISSLQKNWMLQLLILPGLLYFVIFQYIPMYGIIIAFEDYNMKLGFFGSNWVGMANFVKFFSYPSVWKLIMNTIILSVSQMIFTFPLPVVLAIMLNELKNQHYKKFVQTVSYLPHFISTVAICGMIALILSPQQGMVNTMLSHFNIKPIYFLSLKEWFRPIYISSEVWQTVGWGAIIYIAALTSVSQEMYEAATIDGASRVQKIIYISIPAIVPTIIIMLILSLSKLMQTSTDKVLLLQMPVTYDVSDVIGTYIYRRGLQYAEYSYGAAVGLFNTIINLIIVLGVNKLARKYSDTRLF